MRKFYFLLLTILFAAITTNAQVTGTKTIGVDYPTIAAAVADLNATGVGAGGATINVPAGYTETVPSGGLVLGSTLLNASLSGANPLIFQKSGPGANPVLTAFTGGSSINSDGVFKLQGTDYVTIDGIDVAENGANTAAALMEWGYALVNLNASAPFDGCQNNTIKNCSITLDRFNPNGAFGVYSAHNIATNATALVLTAVGDLHSNNKFYSNTISNVNEGFWILGYAAATPFALYDQNNDVGGSSPATGNTLRTMGMTSLFNTFCIYLVNQNGANASYNTIDNAAGGGVSSTTQLIGIYTSGTNSTFTANNNNITLTSTGGAAITAGIYTASTGNLTATNNTVAFADAAGSGTHYGIYIASIATATVTGNTFSASTSGPVTSSYYCIYNSGAVTLGNINNNTVNNFNTSTTGTTGGIYNAGAPVTYNVNNNTFTNINRSGASGTHYCIYTGSPTTGTFNGNQADGVSFTSTTSTGTIYGIYDISSGVTMNYTNNIIRNFSTPTTGTLYGIREFGITGVKTIQNNQIYNFSTTPGGAGGTSMTGISLLVGSTNDISNNQVYSLNSTGTTGGTGGTIIGILISSGTANSIYKNKIYDLSTNSTGGAVWGMQFTAGTSSTAYNNLIGDLRAPFVSSATDGVRGINITATAANSSINLYYNTIYLNASSAGVNFGATGVFHTTSTTATTASLTMRNNIIYNNSFAKGTGFVTAFRRSSGAANTLNNYNAASNNNLFFAGTPAANQLIYYDGTSSAQTLAAYKAGVFTAGTIAPRDNLSVTELSTPFLSTDGANPGFLHINPAVPTVAESGGANIASVTTDYDGDTRNATTPDIGADEFNGIAVTACAGTPTAGTITGTSAICEGQFTILNLSGFSATSGISIQWQSAAVTGGPYSPIAGAIGASYNTGVIPTGTTVYYIATVTCANGGASASTVEFAVTSNANPTITVTPGSPSICTGGPGVLLTASGGVSYTWFPATGLSGTTGATVTANPTSTTTYTITGANAAGCTNTTTVTVTVNTTPIITTSATPASICAGANSQLNSTVDLGSPANSYTLAPLTGQTYTQLSGGGITVINSNAGLTPTFGSGSQDDGGVLITLPFTFTYMGNTFTQMSMSTNGWVAAGDFSTIDAANSRAGGNLFTSAIPNNTIAAWFKDMGANFPVSQPGTGPGSMRHGLIGTDVYAFQWDQAVGSSFSISTTNLISFQVNIYGPASSSPGKIEMIYGPTAGTTAFAAAIGIENGTGGPNNYINALDGSGTSTITSTAWPGNGNGYSFTPAQPTYSWSPATFLNDPTIPNPLASNVTTTTTYTLTVSVPSGCLATSNVTVTVLSPDVSGTVVQPTTCVSNDGSIDITASGGSGGTYTYSWVGTGVNPTSEDQTNLEVGSYTVTVTDVPSGCTRVVTFNLPGPGGCNICPTIPNLTSTPAAACVGTPATLTASALTDMGVTYGITFKYSASALADPYTGGTLIATVPNGSLTSGGTVASTPATFPATGNYFVYAILSPTPLDPGCRPSALLNLTVNSTPTVTCPANITVSNDPNQCGAVVNYPPAIVTGVPAPTVTYSTPSGSFFPRGTTTVTVTATNACGTSTCTFTVTVNDTQPPTITCPANITVNNTPGQCGAIVSYATPTASDNCPGVTVVSAPASGTFFPIGTTTVTSTATDGSGNTATCTFTITVNDNQNPTITCPANVTVNNAAGTCSAVVTYPLPTFSDNCVLAGSTLALSQSTSQAITTGSVACAAGGFHTANSYWRAYNLASLGLPGPLTINSVTFGIELADASGVGTTQPVTVRLHTSAGAFPGGARTLVGTQTFNVPDQTNSLFTGTLTTPVTVPANAILVLEVFTPDGRAPVNNRFYIGSNAAAETGPSYISAPDCAIPNPVTLASIGFPNMHIVLNANGIVGGPSPLTQIAGLPSGGTFPVGVTTNTYRVTDAAGNSSTCSFTVTVVDNQAPVITCPGNITVTSPVGSCTAVVNYTVTATDNCTIASLVRTAGLASGSAFPLGVNTVSWTATDASGNTSSCTFTVTVLDGQLPVISSQPANITACSGSNATFSVTTSNAVTYQWQTFSGGTWNNITGATSSSYTVSNVNIGMNTNTFRVIINGACTTVTSNTATLFVNTLPIITLSSSIPPFLLPGQSLDITATGIPPGGSFVWLKNGVVIAGATGNVLANLTVNDQGSYTVRYTDLNGCVTTSAALVVGGLASDNMWVYPNPNFGQFQVRFYNQNAETATVNVYDSKGAKVYQRSVATTLPYTMISIDLGRAIPNGVYIVELVDGSGKRVGAKQVVVRPN